MAIKRAKYWNNHNVFHFETDDRQVLILDENNNTIGTLREMLFTGKVVSGGDFKDIKHSGVYRAKGLQGVPSDIPADKECILAVTAVGDVNNPDMILYRLISPNGVITENTVSGAQASGWMSGGVGLQNTIKGINGSLGEVSRLETKAKDLASAVNELNSLAHGTEGDLQKLNQRFNGHDHDDRYVNQTGDTMSGDLAMANGGHYHVFNKAGARANFGYMDGNDVLTVGDSRYPLRLVGNGNLTFNGKSVFLADGSAKNADKLNGLTSDAFIQVNENDVKRGNLGFSPNHHIEFDVSGTDKRLINLKSGNDQIGTFTSDSQGNVFYKSGQSEFAFKGHDNVMELNHTWGINLQNHINDNFEPRIVWRRLDENNAPMDGGIWLCQPAKWGGWSDDEKKHTVVWWNGRTNQQIAQYGFGRDGEAVRIFHSPYIGEHASRLFIQNEQPSGDVPYGSVWIGL